MKRTAIVVLTLTLMVTSTLSATAQETRDPVVQAALAGDTDAIASLRSLGPAGLERALTSLDRTYGAVSVGLDRICGQRDCAASRLFWYTDFDEALAAAQAEGKPILSLRLLGRLDEELSCANSRFFRSVLYPDRKVSQLLRDDFVLHWESVRPVPVVRVDFGDGRTLERTLTGNSIHYILDSQGRLVEALPGLYGPRTFQRLLQQTAADLAQAGSLTDGDFLDWRRQRSNRLLGALNEAYQADLRRTQVERAQALAALNREQPGAGGTAMTKSASEVTLLNAVTDSGNASAIWTPIARLHLKESRLDANSRRLVLAKEGLTEGPQADQLITNLEWNIARDTAFNQYNYRLQIHTWLFLDADWALPGAGLNAFNLRVYADLFDTPPDDPWLGLVPDDAYAALPEGGRIAIAD